MITKLQIIKVHGILERELFTINAKLKYNDVIEYLKKLADLVADYKPDDWIYIGEYGHATASDMIIGAYWHLTEWHAGQYSDSYAAMSSLGRIFSPGMASGPEDDSPELAVYQALNELAEASKAANDFA